VPLPADPDPALQSYAHPERLVTADWLSANLGRPGLVIVESDEDLLLYETGHVPGAVKKLRGDGVKVDSPREDLAWVHPRETNGLFVELRHREKYD